MCNLSELELELAMKNERPNVFLVESAVELRGGLEMRVYNLSELDAEVKNEREAQEGRSWRRISV
jgi:hypothetical protein